MDRYELIQELGRGGMGVVHRARQLELNRDVALKVLLPGAEGDDAARFAREIQALMKLTHPNIVRVLDCGELDGRWFYAMELIDGHSLDRVLALSGAMDIPRVLRILRQAASALAACHEKGYLHRDVKPGNLMISGSDHVTLMDFGLVKVQGQTVITVTGEVVGTPHYIAPELIRGDEVGTPADVYALGVMLLELASGRAPFRAEGMAPLLVEIVNRGPVPLESVRADAPAPLVELSRRLVAGDPAARPTAAELVAGIDALSPTGARRTGKSGAARPRSSRGLPSHTPAATAARGPGRLRAVAVPLVLLSVGAVGWLVWPASRAGKHPGSPAPAPVAGTAAGLRVRLDPPRLALVEPASESPWPAGTAWRLSAGARLVAEGHASEAAPRLRLDGLAPAGDYQLEVRPGAGATPITTSFQTPRLARALLRIEASEAAAAISLAQTDTEAFALEVVRQDGSRVWSGRATGYSTYHTVSGLTPATSYRLHMRAERPGMTHVPGVRPFRTAPAGHVAQQREKLRRAPVLAVVGGATGDSSISISRAVEMVPELLSLMEAALQSGDADAVRSCAGALGELHDPRATPLLIAALERPWEPKLIVKLLTTLGDMRQPEGFEPALRQARRLDAWDQATVTAYQYALNWSDPVRARKRYLAVTREPGKYAEVDRRSALPYMMNAEADELIPGLLKIALADPEREAGDLAFHLGLIDGEPARDALRKLVKDAMARTPPAPWLPTALRSLGRAGEAADVPLIVRALSVAGGRHAAVWALGALGGAAAEAGVRPLVDDPDASTRRAVALALGRMRARGSVDALVARLFTDSDSRGRIPRALGMIGDPRACAGLLERLKRPAAASAGFTSDEVDRAEALWSLGVLGAREVRPLAETALGSAHEYTRLRAGEALGWLGDRDAAPALDRALARAAERTAEKDTLARARAWIDGRDRPAGRIVWIDPADPLEVSGLTLHPGENARLRVCGAWATGLDDALCTAAGRKVTKVPQLRLCSRVRGHRETFAGPFTDVRLWSGGPLMLEVDGPQPEGFGFISCWIE